MQISGIAQPQNPFDPYWFGQLSPLRVQSDSRWDAAHNVLIPADQFLEANRAVFDFRPELTWNILIDPERLDFDDIPRLRQALADFTFDLRSYDNRPGVNSELDDVLLNFASQAEAIRTPLYLLMIEVVLLALYYVTMVAALSVRQVEREFAVLRRSGSLWTTNIFVTTGRRNDYLPRGTVQWARFSRSVDSCSDPFWPHQ